MYIWLYYVLCIGFRDVAFICGRAGVCALGAVLAKYAGDERARSYYLAQFKEVLITICLTNFTSDYSDFIFLSC